MATRGEAHHKKTIIMFDDPNAAEDSDNTEQRLIVEPYFEDKEVPTLLIRVMDGDKDPEEHYADEQILEIPATIWDDLSEAIREIGKFALK